MRLQLILILAVATIHAATPTLGAIRWDAWTGSGNAVGAVVEQTLAPKQFHYRVPFFGVEVNDSTVTIDGTTQATMDQEIAYGHYAGLSYWAFLWYPHSSGLDEARLLYQSSPHKALIDYCLIIEAAHFNVDLSLDGMVQELGNATYFKVLGNRPLLYLLGSTGITVAMVDSLRAKAQAAGLGNPYIVLMRTGSETMSTLADLHLDAFSMYAVTWINNGVGYDSLARAEVAQWDWIGKSNAKKLVPHVTTGWDKRTRHLHLTPWEADPGANAWVQMPTPAQLASHVQEAMAWTQANPNVADANTVLIYAWNEHDEGGWLCPTLSMYDGAARIVALRAMLGLPDTLLPSSLASDSRRLGKPMQATPIHWYNLLGRTVAQPTTHR